MAYRKRGRGAKGGPQKMKVISDRGNGESSLPFGRPKFHSFLFAKIK